MNAKEILAQELAERGYDGLCSDDCGCELADPAPCEEGFSDCEAGYKRKMTEQEAGEYDTCMWQGSWMMTTEKPTADEKFDKKEGG